MASCSKARLAQSLGQSRTSRTRCRRAFRVSSHCFGVCCLETLGDDLFDLVATAKAAGLVRNLLEHGQIEQLAQCWKMRLASAR